MTLQELKELAERETNDPVCGHAKIVLQLIERCDKLSEALKEGIDELIALDYCPTQTMVEKLSLYGSEVPLK